MANIKEIKAFMKGYHFADLAARDVQSAINNYKGLKTGSEPYTHANGSTEQLFRLKGTIPVNYRGVVYNIPICIWLLKTHPQSNPIVYVQPTPSMGINPSRYVDASGRVYLSYLSEWQQSSSDLTTLIQILTATFVENMPVYAKPKTEQSPGPGTPTSSFGSGSLPTSQLYYPPPPPHPSVAAYGYNSPPYYPMGGYRMPVPGMPTAQPVRNSLTNTHNAKTCIICDNNADGTTQDIIFCNGACQAWLHRQCAGLSAAAFTGLASSTDLYHCPNCRINELSFENKTLRSELSDMKSKIAQLSEQFSLLSPNSASDPRSDLQADDHADPRSGPPPPHH